MNDVQGGRRVKLTQEDTSYIQKMVRDSITKIIAGVAVAGGVGAISLVISMQIQQARQEESNKSVIDRIDYKYDKLKEGQEAASKQLSLTVQPIVDRVGKLEDNQKWLLRRAKSVEE